MQLPRIYHRINGPERSVRSGPFRFLNRSARRPQNFAAAAPYIYVSVCINRGILRGQLKFMPLSIPSTSSTEAHINSACFTAEDEGMPFM